MSTIRASAPRLCASLAAALVEIHGQHDERALTDAATHRALVDAYGGLEAQAQSDADQLSPRFATPSGRSRLNRRGSRRRKLRPNSPRHAHEELSRLAVQPGEEETLAERRQAMMQGEKVAADIREAHDHLTGDAAILPVLLSASRAGCSAACPRRRL